MKQRREGVQSGVAPVRGIAETAGVADPRIRGFPPLRFPP